MSGLAYKHLNGNTMPMTGRPVEVDPDPVRSDEEYATLWGRFIERMETDQDNDSAVNPYSSTITESRPVGTTPARLNETASKLKTGGPVEQKFSTLAEEWRKETGHLSSITQKVMHPAYQRIIGMGPVALPLILRELERRPSHWFWALNVITDEDPVPDEDAGIISKMADAWIRWGKEKGLL